jgi:hypothetical protein
MTLGDHKIDCISRTRIAFWNQRGDTVRRADILKSDPLRLQFSGEDQPLQTRVLAMSRRQISLTSNLGDVEFKSCAIVDFDFLDGGDGGVIEVIHQGTEKPTVVGTILGATINSRGTATLSSEALSQIATKPLYRRIWRNAKQNKALWIATTAALVGMIASLVFISWPLLQIPGPLVNANKYNLRTLAGQVSFVSKVSDSNYYNQASGRMLIFIVGSVVLAGLLSVSISFSRTLRRRVPASVVACRDAEAIPES